MTNAIRVCGFILFAALPPWATAQQANLSGEIVGTVSTDPRWMIEIRSVNSARTEPAERTFLQPGGHFQFNAIKSGTYEVIVFDPSLQEVKREMASVSGFGTSTVQIRLSANRPATGPGGTVSLRHLAHKVPKAARKEFERGQQAAQRGLNPQAEAHYARAVAIDPECLEAANDLGVLLYRQSRFAESLSVLEKARVADPDSPIVLANIAATLLALQRPQEAEPLARRAFSLDTGGPRIRYVFALSLLANHKAGSEARSLLTEAAVSIPHAHLALAQMCLSEGDRGGARQELERFLAATGRTQPAPARAEAERWLNSLR